MFIENRYNVRNTRSERNFDTLKLASNKMILLTHDEDVLRDQSIILSKHREKREFLLYVNTCVFTLWHYFTEVTALLERCTIVR